MINSIPFRTILEDVLGLSGYPYDSASQAQLEMAARFINRHIRNFWEWGAWPEWTRAEQRAFASPYYASVTYALNNVVYYATTDKYYKALGSTIGNAPTNATHWVQVGIPDAREIAFAQNGLRIVGRPWRVTRLNPYFTARGDQYSFAFNLHEGALSVSDCNLNRVWLLYSDPAPVFTAKVWSSATAQAGLYQRYDIVFYPGDEITNTFPQKGLCYIADYDANGSAVWVPVYFPRAAHSYVVFKAGADLLRHYGQKELAPTYDAQGDAAIRDEWDKINTQGFQNIIGVAP